jgi:hypothetical protein
MRLFGRVLRYGTRRGFERGLLEGNVVWVVLGALALLARLAGRAMHREPELVFSERLLPGSSLEITHEERP